MTGRDIGAAAGRTPWHLWVVGGLSLLWNLFGVFDFSMSTTQGEPYLRDMGMADAQIAYFNAMPAWTYVAWALGVFGGAAGSVLLLLRRRWALHAFIASLAGLLASLVYTFGLSNGAEVMGGQMPIQFVILAVCLFLVWYAWTAAKRGWLR